MHTKPIGEWLCFAVLINSYFLMPLKWRLSDQILHDYTPLCEYSPPGLPLTYQWKRCFQSEHDLWITLRVKNIISHKAIGPAHLSLKLSVGSSFVNTAAKEQGSECSDECLLLCALKWITNSLVFLALKAGEFQVDVCGFEWMTPEWPERDLFYQGLLMG